jgi:hypothetical protein
VVGEGGGVVKEAYAWRKTKPGSKLFGFLLPYRISSSPQRFFEIFLAKACLLNEE